MRKVWLCDETILDNNKLCYSKDPINFHRLHVKNKGYSNKRGCVYTWHSKFHIPTWQGQTYVLIEGLRNKICFLNEF